jgi:hypothetical protein
MARYVLRYLLDPGAGICLWSGNDEAREKFGYPIDLDGLGLPDDVQREGQNLVAWFDTSVDWSYPAAPSPWSDQERVRFQEASQIFLTVLRKNLGPEFEVRDESFLSIQGTGSETTPNPLQGLPR